MYPHRPASTIRKGQVANLFHAKLLAKNNPHHRQNPRPIQHIQATLWFLLSKQTQACVIFKHGDHTVLIFMFAQPIIMIEDGYFLQQLLKTIFENDYFYVWWYGLCSSLVPNIFLLQRFVGFPAWLFIIYKHSTQAGLFTFSTKMILSNFNSKSDA